MSTATTNTTTNVNISMPEKLRDAMRQRMADQGFENASEYVRHLIRTDCTEAAEQKLDAMLLEAEQSGETITIDAGYWEHKKAELAAKLRAMKAPQS